VYLPVALLVILAAVTHFLALHATVHTSFVATRQRAVFHVGNGLLVLAAATAAAAVAVAVARGGGGGRVSLGADRKLR
jgi:hypothetical protein